MASIEERYRNKFAGSIPWHDEGKAVFAGGVTHQTRFVSPFAIYIDHATGALKYDVDGNEIIDYVMGSGSLLMGHSPPEITKAVAAQLSRGTHLGGASTHEIMYANAVKDLMPSIEQIRFTCSGTESTYLALRLARAYTGKSKILKLKGHFHGWHDHVIADSGQTYGGVNKSVLTDVIVAPVDIKIIRKILSENADIAAVIVEASGANGGTYPLPNPNFLEDIRDMTLNKGVIFILDEVITGFRYSKGGAQVKWNISPDLTTMAKVMAGGQPGGAIGGKSEIMQLMAPSGDSEWDINHRVAQAGTYNAQPITAAAGIASLKAVSNGVNHIADENAKRLKDGINEALTRNEVVGHAYGIASIVQLNLGVDCDCNREICTLPYNVIDSFMTEEKTNALRRSMLVNGVEMAMGRKFYVSSVHDKDITDRTLEAFDQSLKDIRSEGII